MGAHTSLARNTVRSSIFLALLALGCPKRIDFGPIGEIKEPDQLLKLTSQAEERIYSMKGDSRLKVASRQGKGAMNLYLAVSRPSLVHFEILGFFGNPQAVFVSDGARFGLYQADQGKYYRGPATPRNLSRFLPLALPIGELVKLMLGEAPRIPAKTASLQLDTTLGLYLIARVSDGLVQRLWVDPSNYRVRQSEMPGADGYQVEFDDFESAGAVTYPREIKFSARNPAAHLELRYKEVRINEALDPTLFQLVPPPGVPVVEVDEAGTPIQSMRPGSLPVMVDSPLDPASSRGTIAVH